MNRKKKIESILRKNFLDWETVVNDISILHKGHNNYDGNNETHFSIILNTNNKNKESKLSIHRKINKLLKDEFSLGLHALEIKIIN
jgi:BolA protein|tara:strand:- start:188 stop:445 length:258 start_codon:yes stop_codon:yes gene_type:complete